MATVNKGAFEVRTNSYTDPDGTVHTIESGSLTVDGNVSVGGTLGATGNTTITGTLAVTGALTPTGGLVSPKLATAPLTAGTMTAADVGGLKYTWNKYSWTNAMVVALGASTDGDITVCTLPAKTVVRRALIVIATPDTSTNALVVSVGAVGTGYIDFVVASDAKAAANTVYGDADAEIGASLKTVWSFGTTPAVSVDTRIDYIPSWTATTAIKAHFTKTTTNLSTVVGSTGSVYLETAVLP